MSILDAIGRYAFSVTGLEITIRYGLHVLPTVHRFLRLEILEHDLLF